MRDELRKQLCASKGAWKIIEHAGSDGKIKFFKKVLAIFLRLYYNNIRGQQGGHG